MKGSTISFNIPEMPEELKEKNRKFFEEYGGWQQLEKDKKIHKLNYKNDKEYKIMCDMVTGFMQKKLCLLKTIPDAESDKLIEKGINLMIEKGKANNVLG